MLQLIYQNQMQSLREIAHHKGVAADHTDWLVLISGHAALNAKMMMILMIADAVANDDDDG